LDGLLWSEM